MKSLLTSSLLPQPSPVAIGQKNGKKTTLDIDLYLNHLSCNNHLINYVAYFNDEVWCSESETELSSKDLLCFFDPA